uniref:Condensin-2 complex subunit H2 n=1 Tax=Otus sunia TaxID=257818 RepID=A0A8C8B0B7_9STRI
MEEAESRFQHLLQPIRDLTKNWEVDVAAQLEEYLEEVRGAPVSPALGSLGVTPSAGQVLSPCCAAGTLDSSLSLCYPQIR